MGAPYGNKNAVGPHNMRKNHGGYITKEGRVRLNVTRKQFEKLAVKTTPALNAMANRIKAGVKTHFGRTVKKVRKQTVWGSRKMGKYARELRSFSTKRGIISKRGISLNSKAAKRTKRA